jgi:hypothetical protein
MRIWSLHPSLLDSKGLIAVWRETLLAQHVLAGKTRGYKNHPQLERFKAHKAPLEAIGFYLVHVAAEARSRGYNFNTEKILKHVKAPLFIEVTEGQLAYELGHLKSKLEARSPKDLERLRFHKKPIPTHPLFKVTQGDVAPWEKR